MKVSRGMREQGMVVGNAYDKCGTTDPTARTHVILSTPRELLEDICSLPRRNHSGGERG